MIIISVVFAGGYVAQRMEKRGWTWGITGLLYILILTIIGHFTGSGFVFNKLFISRILLGIFPGIIGGILGINLK